MASDGPRPLVAGNWKMNGSLAMLKEPRLLAAMLKDVKLKADVMVCPPAIILRRVKSVVKGTKIKVGGQDCHWNPSGAHTGDISAEMLKEAGCTAVIVGHSERRTNHGETDEIVQKKAKAAQRAGLTAIICIGETLEERKGGKTLEVVTRQLKGSLPEGSTAANTVIAYEPVWAIGTGLTPTTAGSGRGPQPDPQGTGRRSWAGRGPERASSMAVRSSRRMPRNSWASPTSTARWSAAPASRQPISSAS